MSYAIFFRRPGSAGVLRAAVRADDAEGVADGMILFKTAMSRGETGGTSHEVSFVRTLKCTLPCYWQISSMR